MKDSADERKRVVSYTDGACLGNPGPGGYGVVLMHNGHRRELSGGYRLTTNNRMEILAAIVALESLKEPCLVTLHSDSEYLVNAMMKNWAKGWRRKGWKLASGQPAANIDLWERMLALTETHDVEFRWVKGHAGDVENERADRLAMAAALNPTLGDDVGYHPQPKPATRPAPRRWPRR